RLEEGFHCAAPAPAAPTLGPCLVEVAMARRPPTASRTVPPAPAFPPQLAAANVPAAGIDVGADAHVVAVPPRDAPQPVRGCGACPAALEALAAWLVACARTPVPLASTGGYWLPLFALLEARGCEG